MQVIQNKYITKLLLLCGLFWIAIPAFAESYDDMMQAVKNNFADDAQALLDRGFDVNTIDEKGNTLTILAAANTSPQVLSILLTFHPKLEMRNVYGESALMMASYKKQKSMVQQLLAAGAHVNTSGWTALHYAASGGDLEIFDQLVQAGADINAIAPDGSSPMILAAREGHIEIIRRLIALKADPDIMNLNEMTALKWSLKRDDTDILELLVEANASR